METPMDITMDMGSFPSNYQNDLEMTVDNAYPSPIPTNPTVLVSSGDDDKENKHPSEMLSSSISITSNTDFNKNIDFISAEVIEHLVISDKRKKKYIYI